MKRILLTLFCFVFAVGLVTAQVDFFDDFESYNAGDLIGAASPDWTTWSGNDGGADDAPVTDEQSFSGDLSLKLFNGTPNQGGPADVILPFGDKYTDGVFSYSMQMYVEGGTGAYFNFQGETTPGEVWSVEFYFDPDGSVLASNTANGNLITGVFTHDQWFEFSIVANLDLNIWELYLDGQPVGVFENANNFIASIDLFPFYAQGNSHYYVDDVAFSHDYPPLPALDLALSSSNILNVGLTGQVNTVSASAKNVGQDTIRSFLFQWSDGTNTYTDTITGVALATLESMDLEHSVPYTVMDGDNQITISVALPNGMTDEKAVNDLRQANYTGYTPAPHKKVVIEEATGTWCQWCPRGAVYMDLMNDRYPDHFIGIAVHNADPMEVPAYDAGINDFPGFTGYPSVLMDREALFDPLVIEQNMLPRLTESPKAMLTNGAEYDPASRTISISVTAEFLDNTVGNWKLNCVITEDSVRGTSPGYAQVNAYSGGGNGPMGGFENLPDPVPASLMFYNHTARALLGPFHGVNGSLPFQVSPGEVYTYNFEYQLPADQEYDNIHIVGILMTPQREMNNATSTTIDEAIANGLVSSTPEILEPESVQLFPNPVRDVLYVGLDLQKASDVRMQFINELGQLVHQEDFGTLQGPINLPVETHRLESGMYLLKIHLDDGVVSKKVVVSRK